MSLTVGIPRELKSDEHRVAVTPDGVRELTSLGIQVNLEAGAGVDSHISDDEYRGAGASILESAESVWADSQLICKVKEPQKEEFQFLREDLVLFTYLHLAAYPAVAEALLKTKTTSVAYETVQNPDGSLPLLAPMSEVAGRMSVQAGSHFLEAHNGGRGVLMGGVTGVRPAKVVILGVGNVGWNAACIAIGMEAEVFLLDKNLERLRRASQIHSGRMITLASNRGAVERVLEDADLVVGAVLVAGGRAPVVVTEDMVAGMKPGSVIVDTAVDQGGCVETTKETTHKNPIYEKHGVVHYAVGNMPGAVPVTSTWALTNATLPYLIDLASDGPTEAARQDPVLAEGVNTENGGVVNRAVAEALNQTPITPSWA